MKNFTSMNNHGVFKTFIFLLLCSGCGHTDEPATDSIKALGGIIISDDTGNVIRVYFSGSTISDVGLVHLKELTNLTTLELSGTKISDAGLVHLKGLTRLTLLWLFETKVTKEGVMKLKAAIPDCWINHESVFT
ncbi:hypothetical protein [uncultured Gimesia sp.]|uniref:hypothetical protein n=1 Tax=uncultured Gimesia sp. TaxID=1678688 RepID=UPI00261CAD6B|nr:hypothetical protein [uncultured Gimesia sp.]